MKRYYDVPKKINREIIQCRKCPRLVEWREKVATEKTRRFADWNYWGKPIPGFGDPNARFVIVGLAPAAHGGNRTGRMFTGDRSGDWLYRVLHKAGFANQPNSESLDDGMKLHNCYIIALCRCAPPANKPTAGEFANCSVYMNRELDFFLDEWQKSNSGKAILCLGQLSYRHTLQMLESREFGLFKPRPKFSHAQEMLISDQIHLFASFHPSQQNTFTGKLTEEMFDRVFERINELIKAR
jgi:uracil-DNA glycosylase family 4